MIDLTYGELLQGTEEGYGKDWKEEIKKKESIAQKIDAHIYLFSGAKTYQQLLTMNELLVDDTGKLRSLSEFRTEVLKVHDTYNLTYLETEYRTTKRSAQAARQWQTFVSNSDLFPNLQYRTVGDKRVRDEHEKLDNIVKPINDAFWDTHYPPNGWNCRCRVQSSDAAVTKATPKISLDKGFANNVGKTGDVFDPEGHPFFKVPKKTLKKIRDGRK